MKLNIYTLLMAGLLSACSGSDSTEDPTPVGPVNNGVKVSITTEILTRAQATAKKEFADGDEMNVWAKTYGSPTADDIVAGIKAKRNGSNWTLTPDVYLDQTKAKNAFIYAVSPYSADYASSANSIGIDLNKQIDILYSGSYVPVSLTTNTAKLTMKHALSLAAFNIINSDYNGAGKLTSLTLTGDSVYVKGKMTVDKGKVAGTEKGSLTVAFDKTVTSSGWTNDLPRLWVIPLPFNTKTTKAYLKATIDGVEYTSPFPEVEMRIGYQYVFHLVLTNNGLEFIPNQTTSVALDEESDQIDALDGHAILTLGHQGTEVASSVYIQGDNVFGTVKWDANNGETYADGLSHAYDQPGNHSILMETWNSIGFQLRNLKGIHTIDISQYE